MHHFFIKNEDISGERAVLSGDNFNHAVNVLRLRSGEKIILSDDDGRDLYCTVSSSCDRTQEILYCNIDSISCDNHELCSKITLYQCLPKSDKMELIIQKATELGVTDIVPVESRNCVMKLDPKKVSSKISRWQGIAEAAAKQSKRSIVPVVHEPVSFVNAVKEAEGSGTLSIIPYEDENGMLGMCRALVSITPGVPLAVFIGPEGGFDPLEIKFAVDHGTEPVSLGKRILRTETAAIAVLSVLMIKLEIAAQQEKEEEDG